MPPVRSGSVSCQIAERNDRYPLSLPPENGELANMAVATGWSARLTRSLRTMSASEEKSRLTCTVAVDFIMSSPSWPFFCM